MLTTVRSGLWASNQSHQKYNGHLNETLHSIKYEKSTAMRLDRQKLCNWLDRQNISPLYSWPLYPDKGIQMWMWWRGTTSVFPVDICKTLYLLSILEGSSFLLSFPPNWFSQLGVVLGVGAQAAVNLCLTPSWAPTTLPIKLTRPKASL